jgi:hypothetical protein
MRFFRLAFLFPLLGGLLGFFFPASPCRAGLQEQDQNIRKFIRAAAAKDKTGAFKSLGITSDNAEGVSLVQSGIETLGGKKIDDITRTNFEYNWANGTETLNATYHIRAGNEGFDFGLELESVDQKPASIQFSFEKSEANPWEVRAINFTYRHWGLLLAIGLLAVALFVVSVVGLIRYFMAKNSKPPKIPGA